MKLSWVSYWRQRRRGVVLASFIVLAFAAVFLFAPGLREKAWRPGRPLAKDLVKIGVIHVSGVEGASGGYAHAHDLGIREMREAVGLAESQILRKIGAPGAAPLVIEGAMRECIEQGANVIIATSWEHMAICEKLAGEYPGVIFAHASGIKHNDVNFTNYFGRIYQPRYLSGMAAGLRTATNKIGYVAAMGKDNSEVTIGINAFAIGVEAVNPEARVHVRALNSWLDPENEARAAQSLIAAGCDVIAQHCDTPAPQIEAQRAGVWGIGYNSDMKDDAPKAVIASVVWNWGTYYTRLIKSVIDGTFTTTPYMGDMGDGMVGLTALDASMLPPGGAGSIAAARKRIGSGYEGIFEGGMETNDGRIIGATGRRLNDVEILGGMNWYYRNVLE
ncbi:MAG: BMP family ABC transporter substrate-binding protein [Desulfovibrionaceae bacterium]|nr:BMP family ABC transporter substrate-binding protein [Desulfovibrionaceae bacterium]